MEKTSNTTKISKTLKYCHGQQKDSGPVLTYSSCIMLSLSERLQKLYSPVTTESSYSEGHVYLQSSQAKAEVRVQEVFSIIFSNQHR